MRVPIHLGATALAGALWLRASPAQGDESLRVAVVGGGTDGDAVASVVASKLTSPAAPADPDAFRGALGAGELRSLSVADVRLGAGASLGDEADAAWNAVAGALPHSVEPPTPSPPVDSAPVAATAPAEEATASTPPDADTGPVASAVPRAPVHTWAGTMAVLCAALQGGSRHFAYVDRLTPTLRPYDLFVAPLVTVRGEIYPFMSSAIPVLGELGATGSYARAFGLASQDSSGTCVSTSWQAFDLGLRERLCSGARSSSVSTPATATRASRSTTPSARPGSSPAFTTSSCAAASTVASYGATSPCAPT